MGKSLMPERPGREASMEELTGMWIRCLVPLSIVDLWLRGGVTDADLAADEAQMLERAMHGESLLFYNSSPKAKKKGARYRIDAAQAGEFGCAIGILPGKRICFLLPF